MSVKARRALVSVYDKSGIEDLVQALHALEIEIISTGGTARSIRAAGVPCKDISEITGLYFPISPKLCSQIPQIEENADPN